MHRLYATFSQYDFFSYFLFRCSSFADEYPVYFQCQLLPNEVVGCDQVVKSKFCQGTDDFMDVVLTL